MPSTTALDLTGAAILTTYVQGSTFNYTGGSGVQLFIEVTGNAGTTVTQMSVKLQGSYDGTNWVDIISTGSTTATAVVEQNTTPVASAVVWSAAYATVKGFIGGLRVAAKRTGAVQAADRVRVYAVSVA